MFIPKKYKFIKVYKNVSKNQNKNFSYSSGIFCSLISLNYGILTTKRYELIRRFFTKKLKRKSKVYHKICLNKSLTKKSLKSRMGKGKGKLNLWYAFIKPGLVLFEVQLKESYDISFFNLKALNKKLTFSCKLCFLKYKFKFSMLKKVPVLLNNNIKK